jgi:hypothetical protein
LDLLPAAREPVARPPAPYLKAWELGFNAPRAPADAAVEREGGLLQPDALVLADCREAVAEVDSLGAGEVGEQLVELRRPFVDEAEQVALGRRMEAPQERQDLLADEAALGGRVRGRSAWA